MSSPPSRAAWIEILIPAAIGCHRVSRRLHGRRGLKYYKADDCGCYVASPPSRAAWIEMLQALPAKTPTSGRRLHGRRGLKYSLLAFLDRITKSPPSRAAWIEMVYPSSRYSVKRVAAFTGGVD